MKTVAVCCSKRYAKDVKRFCDQLEGLGIIVFRPNFDDSHPLEGDNKDDELTKLIFKGLTLEHFDWIRKADVCFVYNKEDYAGISVSLEMGYANALGKPTYALSAKTGDPCRDALIDKIAKTPRALAKLLA